MITYNYHMNNLNIEVKSAIRDLSVFYDPKLLMILHIDQICKDSFRTLGFIFRQCKLFKNPDTLICLFNSLVRSKLEFASVVWNP